MEFFRICYDLIYDKINIIFKHLRYFLNLNSYDNNLIGLLNPITHTVKCELGYFAIYSLGGVTILCSEPSVKNFASIPWKLIFVIITELPTSQGSSSKDSTYFGHLLNLLILFKLFVSNSIIPIVLDIPSMPHFLHFKIS